MLLGVLALIVLSGLLSLVLSLRNIAGLAIEPFIFTLIAGGIGAIVSVMSRMSFGGLVLEYEAGSLLLRLLGGFRPLIGGIFGTAIYVLIQSDLLPIAGPTDPSKQLYFFSGVAFIAGFSERWAQDMLSVTGDRLKATSEDQPTKPPALETVAVVKASKNEASSEGKSKN